MCVCVCVCVGERERERESERKTASPESRLAGFLGLRHKQTDFTIRQMKTLKDIKEGIRTSRVNMKECSILGWRPNSNTMKTIAGGLRASLHRGAKTMRLSDQFHHPPPFSTRNSFV